MKVIPDPPGRLNENAGPLVGLVDFSLNARNLLQQRLFIHHACVRIDQRALLLWVSRRGKSDDESDHKGAKDEARSRQLSSHAHPPLVSAC